MKKKIAGLIAVILIVLTSCVTTVSQSEITPLNLYSKSRFAATDKVFFVGEGQDSSIRQAQLLSYMDLYEKVYRYLGIEPEPESYRELSTLGTISRYNLKIQDSTSYGSNNGNTYVLIASADKNLLAKDRSKDMLQEEEQAQQVVDIVLKGDEYIKQNRDVDAVKCYLQSMVLSYGLQYVDDEFSFSAILEEVLRIVKSFGIEVSKVNSEEITCRVKVTRKDSMVPSRVKNSQIKATFISEDGRGLRFEDSFYYTTDEKGQIDFIPRVYNTVKSGEITFGFDFDAELKELAKLSPTTAEIIRNELSGKTAGFSYCRKYDGVPFGICTQCVTVQGITEAQSWLDDLLVNKYKESGIDSFVFGYIEDEREDEMLERFRTLHPDSENLVVLRIGVSEVYETKMNVCSVTVEGTVSVYDLKNNKTIYESELNYGNGLGNSIKEAQDAAFKNFALKMFNTLKAYYV